MLDGRVACSLLGLRLNGWTALVAVAVLAVSVAPTAPTKVAALLFPSWVSISSVSAGAEDFCLSAVGSASWVLQLASLFVLVAVTTIAATAASELELIPVVTSAAVDAVAVADAVAVVTKELTVTVETALVTTSLETDVLISSSTSIGVAAVAEAASIIFSAGVGPASASASSLPSVAADIETMLAVRNVCPSVY